MELSYQIAIPIQEPEISADYERFIETNAEVIKDIVTSALQETKYEAIIGTGFMDKFSGDMIKEINTALNTDIVKDFYITHLVMQ